MFYYFTSILNLYLLSGTYTQRIISAFDQFKLFMKHCIVHTAHMEPLIVVRPI